MKKLYISLVLLFTAISIAMAQPAMMTKGSSEMLTQIDTDTVCQDENDRLSVTITTTGGATFHHPQHPEVGSICPFNAMFRTTQSYAWYRWEISFQDTIIETTDRVDVMVTMPGYIKVTVGDNYGHTGSDYIWFNVHYVPPMENLIMELDDNLHANFSGIATEDHRELRLYCVYNLDEWISHDFSSSPGEWTYKDIDNTFCSDTLLLYATELHGFNDCQPIIESTETIPGLLLNSKKLYYNTWYLDIKTMIQSYIQYYIDYHFVYFVYTIDQYGQRHHFHDENGNPVILTIGQTEWEIPPDLQDNPYFQCGVARRLDDGSYKLLSLSNKVVNPLFSQYDPLLFHDAFHIEDMEESQTIGYCLSESDSLGVIVYGEPDCPSQSWEWEGDEGTVIQTGDSIVIQYHHVSQELDIVHHGCSGDLSFHVSFVVPDWENPFPEPVFWKHTGETIHLDTLELTEPGNYSVTYSAYDCSDTYSVEVFDNVEIHRVTVDLRTNKNKVTWQTIPEQAAYIKKVKVYSEDGNTYIKPYTQGYFLATDGSDEAAQSYRVVGLLEEGEECPIASYGKGTLHTEYLVEDGDLRMTWNIPYVEPGASDELTGFYVCMYDPNLGSTGTVTVVEQLGPTVTEYSCSSSHFFWGKAVVAAEFNHDEENLSFSNLYTVLAVDENGETIFSIYPNPAQGQFTVEGDGMMRVTNVLGQEIMVKAINGKATIELPQGLYFVKLGNKTQKIVVE